MANDNEAVPPFHDPTETGWQKGGAEARYKRKFYTMPGFTGNVYADGDAHERCPAEWLFPCQHCHRKLSPEQFSKATAKFANGKLGEAVAMAVPTGLRENIMTDVEKAALVKAAVEAHQEDLQEVDNNQYVYVYENQE